MGVILNRRRVCGGDSVPSYLKGYTLIHHWEADDWTVGTNWTDRVGGLVFTRRGNPIKQNGLIVCKGWDYFYLYPDANAASPNGINMGSLWAVEVEGMINSSPGYIADFGSVGYSNHAFCLFCVSNNYMDFNPKFTGNDSASLYRNGFDFTPYYGKLTKATIGTKEVDSDTVLPFYVLEKEIHDSPNTLTKSQALFNRNFHDANIYAGRCVSYLNREYVYIKSIKIYTKYQ